MDLQYRPYTSTDRDACILLFHTNVPRFFRDHELHDFAEFLDSAECQYYVITSGGKTVGCGGFGIQDGNDTADLCWGIVHNDYHGQRIGEYLLLFRLCEIARNSGVRYVRLGTCQHTEGFFQRYGFETQLTIPDGITDGLDDVEMRLELTGANRMSGQVVFPPREKISDSSSRQPSISASKPLISRVVVKRP